jgi:hypothetical protein
MTTKTKGRSGGNRPTQKLHKSVNTTLIDLLAGRLSFTKSSRINFDQKCSWQRGQK